MPTGRGPLLPLFFLLFTAPAWADLTPLDFQAAAGPARPQTFTADLPLAAVGPLWLLVPPVDRPLTLTWNGQTLFETGDPTGRGRVKTMASQAVLLPGPSADPRLVVTWYGPGRPNPGFFFGGRDEVQGAVFLRNALGPGLDGALVVTALVLSLAIGLLLVFTRGTLRAIPGRALLAANLCFILTWLNMILSLPTIPETPLAILTHWGLTAWSVAGLYLALEFTGAFSPRWKRRLLQWSPLVLPGLVWLTLGQEPAEVVSRYNVAVAPFNLGFDLLTTLVAVAAVLRKPSVRTWSFAAIAVPSMAAAFHDIWWFVVLGQRPYWAMLPLVGLVLNLYFVIVFFYDASKLYRDLQHEVSAQTHNLERFVGLLGHDMRNVLQGIGAVAGVLADGTLRPRDPAALDRLAEALRTATREAQEVLGTLLNLSQLRGGVLVPRPTAVAAADLWEAASQPWVPLAADRGIVFESQGDEGLVFLADREMTLSILRNLVQNAVRHGSPGSRVGLETRRTATGGVNLAVVNPGVVLAPEVLAGLFDWSGLRLRGEAGSGTGFGLVLCRDLADRQGFSLTASSSSGQTRFVLGVPPGNVLPPPEGKPLWQGHDPGPRLEP